MASRILSLPNLTRNIADLTDDQLIQLAEEPEFLIESTPLERELVVRLGAALELTQLIEAELQAEIARLAPCKPRKAGRRIPSAESLAFAARVEAAMMERPVIRVATDPCV